MIRTTIACLLLVTFAAPAHAAPRWCTSYKSSDKVYPNQAKNAIADFRNRNIPYHELLIEAAGFTCGLPDEAATAEVLQIWMAETGLAESEAIASLAARLDPEWKGQHEALCQAMRWTQQPPELAAMRLARAQLFGCANGDRDDAGWMNNGPARLDALDPFLDGGAMERDHDEIVRLSWIASELWHMLDPKETGPILANYVVVQYDIKAIDYNVAWKQLDAAPYRGNAYARTVLGETIAHTRAAIARLDAAVAKRTEDATWKDLIITVPQKASAAWLAAAAAHKDMLAHSDSAKGCEATLRADVAAIIKPLAKSGLEEIAGKLTEDPLAGLMLQRLARCTKENGDEATAKVVSDLSEQVRPIRGPRSAAFFATSKALAALRKPPFGASRDMSDPDPPTGRRSGSDLSTMSKGVIASATAGKDGTLKLTFVKSGRRYTERLCKETDKIDRVMQDGTVVYRQTCRDGGEAWEDETPSPRTVPASCTAGLAKGRFVKLEGQTPWAVYADKSQKRLLAAYCFSLE